MSGFPSAAQQAIIEESKGNILVSAAAGSGKTAVMTGRIIDRIVKGEMSLQHALILTFTNAASESMERKIRQALKEASKEARLNGEEDKRVILDRENLNLQRAHIQTIHAFCLWLIQNFPYEVLDEDGNNLIDADFQIMDEQTTKELFALAISEILDEEYKLAKAGENPLFLKLLDNYSSSRSDRQLRGLMTSVHTYLRSLPNYRQQIGRELERLLDTCNDFEGSEHIRYLYRELRLRVDFARNRSANLEQELRSRDWKFVKSNATRDQEMDTLFQEIISRTESAQQLLDAWEENAHEERIWDRIFSLFEDIKWTKPRISKTDPDEKRAFVDSFMVAYMDLLHTMDSCSSNQAKDMKSFPLIKIFTMTMDEIQEGLQNSYAAIEKFFHILLAVDTRFQQLKREKKRIDFQDYEHFALLILQREDGRRFCQEYFTEVYVDEYQDTSSIQETILTHISPNALFMVGDVKQSIYRFRHARPETFLAKAQEFAINDEAGQYFLLQENFRSEDGILKGINEIFQRLMTVDFTGIDYRDGHTMATGRVETRTAERIEIIPFIKEKEKNLAKVLGEDAEHLQRHLTHTVGGYTAQRWLKADMQERSLIQVAQEIKRLHEEEHLDYREMAIMARGNGTCDTAARILKQMGIPQNRKVKATVLDNYLLQVQVALLQVLDNVRQDIPLATILLSDVIPYPFLESELLQIRLFQKQEGERGDLYHGLLSYTSAKEDDLAIKIQDFIRTLDSWRKQEKNLTPKALLETIYLESDYLAKVRASEGEEGVLTIEEFLQNVQALRDMGRKTLFQLVRFFQDSIENQETERAENDFSGDGVHVVTFHGSKGLEFSHVFLVGLHSAIKDMDVSNKIVIQEDLGIGFDILSDDGSYTYKSHLRLAMQNKQRERYLTEEICLFYVAMSRAKAKLYLCFQFEQDGEEGGFKLSEHMQFLLQEAVDGRDISLGSHLLQEVKSYQDMLLLGLVAHRESLVQDFFATYFPQLELRRNPALVNYYYNVPDSIWSFHTPVDMRRLAYDLSNLTSSPVHTARNENRTQLELVDGFQFIRSSLPEFYEASMEYPSLVKQTVSEIKRQSQAQEVQEDTTDISINLNIKNLEEEKTTGFTSAQIGTLLHRFFRFVNLQNSTIQDQIASLAENAFFSEQEIRVLQDFSTPLETYLNSSLAKAIATAKMNKKAFHELPFTFRYKEEANVSLIQGMIDLWYILDDEICLVDFKSDYLPGPNSRKLFLERYGIQLKIYALALESAMKKPVDKISIWSIRNGEEYVYKRTELGLSEL